MSHLTQSMVEQFFELEKESARGVLRKEMDSAMDTIFKQMKRKLMQLLVESGPGANETGYGLAHLGGTIDREQQLYSCLTDTNQIPSATAISQSQFRDMNASNLSQHDGPSDPQHHEQQLYFSSNQIPFISTKFSAPDNTSNQFHDDDISLKNELCEIVNIIPNEPIPSSSTQPQPFNDQSNDNDDDLFDDLDDEDCDCPDCVGDVFAVKEEGDYDDDDDVQLIDESNESNSRPTKRARLGNDPTQAMQHPNSDARVITLSFKCRQCSSIFEHKHQLNTHLKSVHSIGLFRCLYRDCNQSMDHSQLAHHYLTEHSNNFHCENCSAQFKNVKILLRHYSNKHQEGIFQWARANCDFTAEFVHLVLSHLKQSHKSVCKTIACNYSGCVKMFNDTYELKVHERRVHRGVKPFRCRWPDCRYGGSANKSHAIKHIRTKHLQPNQLHVEAQVWLEVMADLL